ncbi:MAG: glutaredoxin family protein [Candidatus Sericytochromatia bacterium]
MSFWKRLQQLFHSAPSPASTLPTQPQSLVLYKFDSCPYCRRVMQHIAQHQLPVSYRDVRQEPRFREELRQHTGGTQVPCLVADGQPLLESRDIVAYLQRCFPDRKG